MITATGLGSGIDVEGLVSQLVAAERAGSDLQFNRKSAKLNVQVSALGEFKSGISAFKSSLSGLNSLNTYDKNTTSSSDSAVLGISAGSKALANDYSVDITQLADTHSLASTSFADKNSSALGTGTLTIRFGTTSYNSGSDTYSDFNLNPDSSVMTVNIDSSNNTLEGIMESINEADSGVKASIVNDGTGYRLLLASESTGEENSLEISVSDDDGNNIDSAAGLSRFAFNAAATNLIQTKAAQDAEFTVNGLAISSASNTVKFAIDDVTLNLKQVSTETVDLSVKPDTNSVLAAVNSFIGGYNKMVSIVNKNSSYDADAGVAGVLMSDFTVRSITGQVDNVLRNAIEGLTGDFTSVAELGISTSSDGTLALDAEKFKSVLASHPADVKKIFSAFGTPSDTEVSFHEGSSKTATGDYAVNITALASAAAFTGTGALPDFGGGSTLTIDADNDNFTIEVDGVDSGEISLTAGTYTDGESLASEIQAQINGSSALRDSSTTVSVSYDGGSNSFVITSDRIGSNSTVNMLAVDTNSLANLGFDVADGIEGSDVEGTIGGLSATGIGQYLTANAGTAADGLSLLIEGSTLGARGTVAFTNGLTSQLDLFLEKILDEESALGTRLDGIEDNIKLVDKNREEMELRWEKIEDRYRRQFNAMDILLSGLTSTGNYLEEQFKSLVKPNTRGG